MASPTIGRLAKIRAELVDLKRMERTLDRLIEHCVSVRGRHRFSIIAALTDAPH